MKPLDNNWLDIFLSLGWLSWMTAGIFLLVYISALRSINDPTRKYEFASALEVKYLKTIAAIFSLGISFFLFHFISNQFIYSIPFEYLYIGFVAAAVTIIVAYGLNAYFSYYYPSILETRLNSYRNHERKSPLSLAPMVRLEEPTKAVHMIEHKNDGTEMKDFDLWLDQSTHKLVMQEFDEHEHNLVCDHCQFRTLHDYKEEVINFPKEDSPGALRKYYKCTYCGHEKAEEFKIISQKEEKEYSVLDPIVKEMA